ncbi:hypothetical protein DM794_17305 [Paenarthrobacter ureafaciens]|uniref:Lipoprotein n=1 Tax=Paenarthrobacter ureafaciens TaxID=37931 RepID=A0AAX3EL14_PAEUR|nr:MULTISPECIES: hypothetical protein [Paenarthrobacter]OEH61876.1 hypothetical protein A5N13_15985 [Arthrobacter sp. D4]OEH64178.1 hypothetical protein A5N17_06965 [Arthrobacter sp. D2]MDO5863506.1 hypothetical protein [Paenarthrobacter sp. SD-2]MDO5874578.1 hypothetical protein [Paenarthrobacter sp. SD-1]MEC3851211.1 hypothetical protein [Paenarthrobacter ureafaciens]
MRKPRSGVVRFPAAAAIAALGAALMLAGCGGTPKMDVKASCEFLNNDSFKPDGNQQQQSKQLAEHYHQLSEKLTPEIADPIKEMAAIMDKAASSSLGAATQEQQQQLTVQFNKIGEFCK